MDSKKLILFLSIIFYFNNSNAFDLKILALDHHAYETVGTYDSKLTFQNLGTTNIQYFTIKWSLNNVLINSLDVNILDYWSSSLLPSSSSSNYYFPLIIQQSLPLLTQGDFMFKMWIESVHGLPDSDHTNDSISYMIHITNYLPTKHVLLEKYSHTTCGPCYGGDLTTNQLLTNYDNLSVVTIHNAPDDPMSFPEGNLLDNQFATAHPNFVFDRKLFNPSTEFGSSVWNGESTDLERRMLMKEGLEVSIIHQSYDISTRELNVTLRADFYANYQDTIAFNAWITEDSILGYQANAPAPFDYYHMHVARSILGGIDGNIITDQTTNGSSIAHTFTYILPATFNENNIQVVGFVQRKNGANIDIINSTDPLTIQENYVQTNELLNLNLKIFPNPTENSISIQTDQTIISLAIHNLVGMSLQ